MDNPFTIIFLCAVLIMPVITFFFCLLFNMNLGGSFDNGDYKEYFKESFLSSIYLNFLIGTLINTAALFVFNVAGVIIVYIILFVGMSFLIRNSENIINKTIKMLNFIYLINTIKVND